jgi:carboxylesterase type B
MVLLNILQLWIHGGGFLSGSTSAVEFDGKYISSKYDVIIVTIQYRLGPLGFLALGADKYGAAGNAGLLDQQLSLKWVHDHIAAFGGDPGRVTLFGESAGSASVSYHLLSPGSADFFRSGIMESGAVPSQWAFQTPRDAAFSARVFAEKVGLLTSN